MVPPYHIVASQSQQHARFKGHVCHEEMIRERCRSFGACGVDGDRKRAMVYGGGTTWWYGIMVSLIVPNDDKPRKVFCLELPFLHGYAGMVPWYGTIP